MVAYGNMEFAAVAVAAVITGATVVRFKQYWFPPAPVTKHELPTVSLLIPARNETHAITRALTNALGLDYPKLEIIVLDDESQDNTSEKIRSFAQDGVRFIEGGALPEGWIGKNWACHQLAEAASGDYLIFCDMDVQLSSKGVARLIRHLQTNGIAGCSVYPRLELFRRIDTLAAPLHAWFLLLLPRISSLSPAYGGLLVFDAGAYRQHGGYRTHAGKILPELSIARDIAPRKFRFFVHSGSLGITLHKKASSLIDSRVRYLAPLFRENPAAGTFRLLLIVAPVAALAASVWAYLMVAAAYALLMRAQTNHWIIATVLLPVISAGELGLLVYSVAVHARGRATWKNRVT